jgi:hypothetical protein
MCEPEPLDTCPDAMAFVVEGLDLCPVVATLALAGDAETAKVITDGRWCDAEALGDFAAGESFGVEAGYFVDP